MVKKERVLVEIDPVLLLDCGGVPWAGGTYRQFLDWGFDAYEKLRLCNIDKEKLREIYEEQRRQIDDQNRN